MLLYLQKMVVDHFHSYLHHFCHFCSWDLTFLRNSFFVIGKAKKIINMFDRPKFLLRKPSTSVPEEPILQAR
jgi:hypothetical protein